MQSPHGKAMAETAKCQKRSPSEERADAHIVSLEAQLVELEVANKFEECATVTERIDLMKKAQIDISGLKAELGNARATRDFKACAEIQKQINELKVKTLRLSLWRNCTRVQALVPVCHYPRLTPRRRHTSGDHGPSHPEQFSRKFGSPQE